MKTSTDFAIHLSRFLSEYLPHERGMSHHTILAYRDTFMQFIRYMKEEKNIPVEKLTLDKLSKCVIVDFLEWVQNERNCSTSTRNYGWRQYTLLCHIFNMKILHNLTGGKKYYPSR